MKKNELLQSVKVIILGLVLSLGVSYIFAGIGGNTEKLLPPKNNVPGPINEGISNQIKDGGLSVNGFGARGNALFANSVETESSLKVNSFAGGGNNKPLCADPNGNIVLCTL